MKRSVSPDRCCVLRRLCVIVLAVLLMSGCAGVSSFDLRFPESSVVLRVGSYNIRSGRTPRGVVDLQPVADQLARANLDLLLLQEVDWGTDRAGETNQAEALAEMLGMHWSFAVADRTMDGGQLGNAVLSRYPIVRSGSARLPGSVFRVRRAAAYALVDAPGGMRVLALSGHFSLAEADRRKSSGWIARTLAATDGPVIAGVDLNAIPGSQDLRPLESAVTLSPPVATYPAGEPRLAIDRIVVAPGDRLSIRNTEVGRSTASDHRLLYAEVVVSGAGTSGD